MTAVDQPLAQHRQAKFPPGLSMYESNRSMSGSKKSETSQRKARSIFLNSFLFVLVSGFSVSHFPADDVIAISFTDRKFVTNGPQPQREHETEVPEFFFSLEKNAAKEFSFFALANVFYFFLIFVLDDLSLA